MKRILLMALLALAALPIVTHAQERNPVSGVAIRPLQEGLSGYEKDRSENCIRDTEADTVQLVFLKQRLQKGQKFGKITAANPLYSNLPIEGTLNSSVWITNYYDHDTSTAATIDYQGNAWLYNNHRGTDFVIRNFKEMDKGKKVLAVGAGTVISVVDSWDDRNYSTALADPNKVNLIVIQHADGTRAYYAHLMKNSALVLAGQQVVANQHIANVGSSGFSDHPHVHLETRLSPYSQGKARDHFPYASDPFNPDNMWSSAPAYVKSANLFRFIDIGVTNKTVMGSLAIGPGIKPTNAWSSALKERFSQPAILNQSATGTDTTFIWFQYQGTNSFSFYIDVEYEWISVNNWFSFGTVGGSITGDIRLDWGSIWAQLPYNANILRWKVSIKKTSDNSVLGFSYFNIGNANTFAPRFKKRGFAVKTTGTNVLVTGAALRAGERNGTTTYTSLTAGVSVAKNSNDSVTVTIPYSVWQSQKYKDVLVQVVDANGSAYADTCFIHVANTGEIDGTLPVELVSFKGHWDGSKINLEWETASELNNVGYIIEHSSDKETWNRVADWRDDERLQGLGSSSNGKKYYFDVAGYDPAATHYFRLTDVDYDGSMESHPAIRIEKPLTFDVGQAYPNPFNPSVNLNLVIPASGDLEVKVYDLLGREVESQLIPAQPGKMKLNFDGSSWSSGLYVIAIRQGEHFVIRKASLVK